MSEIINETELDRIIAEHDKHSGFKHLMNDNCWDAGIEITKQCGNLFDLKYSIVFSVLTDEKIKVLMRTFTNLEWLGYLVGFIDHEHQNVYVEDIIIPKQKVSYGAVTDVDYEWNEGLPIIGVIHSHHGMGAFFSGTDDTYINQNHDVSIVVASNPKSPIKGQVRVKAQCGKYFICERVTFAVNSPLVLDVGAFMEVIRTNIQKPVYNNYTYVSPVVRRFQPNDYQRNIGGNIASRIGFTPFNVEDMELEAGENIDDYNIDEELEGLNETLDEVDRLMDDHNQRESWSDLVAKQNDLFDEKEKEKEVKEILPSEVFTIDETYPIKKDTPPLDYFCVDKPRSVVIKTPFGIPNFGWLFKK